MAASTSAASSAAPPSSLPPLSRRALGLDSPYIEDVLDEFAHIPDTSNLAMGVAWWGPPPNALAAIRGLLGCVRVWRTVCGPSHACSLARPQTIMNGLDRFVTGHHPPLPPPMQPHHRASTATAPFLACRPCSQRCSKNWQRRVGWTCAGSGSWRRRARTR